MEQENENGKYYFFIGVLFFFLFVGTYFVFNLLVGNYYSHIFDNFISTTVEEPVKIEKVKFNNDVFIEDKFKELKASGSYHFDVNNVVVGGKNPFVVRISNDEGKKSGQ